VVHTYLSGSKIWITEIPMEEGKSSIETLSAWVNEKTAAVLIQHPNFLGQLEEVDLIADIAHQKGALLVMSVDPISLGILKTPGAFGADIAVGEGQSLGNAISFGGPYVGFFATRRDFIRQMPGRIVGKTVDLSGRPAFCLTLQTREQHIKRERATSSICTNQALNALASAVCLATLGPSGLREMATLCLTKAHDLKNKIASIAGYTVPFGPTFFKEFVMKPPIPAALLLKKLLRRGILGGIDLGQYDKTLKDHILVCVTEQHTLDEIDRFSALLSDLSRPAKKVRGLR